MAQYCVNNFNDHEVHKIITCNHLPNPINRTTFFANSDAEAMRKARRFYANAGSCVYCMSQNNFR